ncbi:MAG: HAD family hydrolase [Opitutaceae bacterium]|nr:HAD family hydrolase [Opitutaceae bacterium]
MVNDADFDWIFFDCFNTLIDDFDEAGDESGLVSLPALAVELGFFATAEAFVSAYARARRFRSDGREIHLPERLAHTLAASLKNAAHEIADGVARLQARWEDDYHRLIRPTPGAAAMLAHWSGRKPAGVVSNFFLPDRPERYLEHFGLRAHFRFVVDSASFGYRKPDRRIFLHALAQAGLSAADAHRVLYIGDRNDLDVIPARELGMQVIHFHRGRSRLGVEPTPAGITAIHDWAEFR